MEGFSADDFVVTQHEQGRINPHASEKGVVLIVVLFVLLILAAIGLSASDTAIFEHKMSNSALNQNKAFQSAESGLRAGEEYIESLSGVDRGTSACNASAAPCVSIIDSVNGGDFVSGFPWGGTNTYAMPGYTGTGADAVSAAPEFIVEYITNLPDTNSSLGIGTGGVVPGSDFYRITARGTGRTNAAHAIVQSIYARRF